MKTPLTMKEHQAEWIEGHLYLFQMATAATKEQKIRTYEIYNDLYLDKKKVGGCGRCWNNVKQLVYSSYLHYKNNL